MHRINEPSCLVAVFRFQFDHISTPLKKSTLDFLILLVEAKVHKLVIQFSF
jgi:hypothetical protein